MKIIVARRREGKTKGCVEYLRQHPRAYMVVHSKPEAERVRREYTRNESEVAKRIVTFDEVVDSAALHNVSPAPSGLVIDNADLILQQVFERQIEALAVTWPDEVR